MILKTLGDDGAGLPGSASGSEPPCVNPTPCCNLLHLYTTPLVIHGIIIFTFPHFAKGKPIEKHPMEASYWNCSDNRQSKHRDIGDKYPAQMLTQTSALLSLYWSMWWEQKSQPASITCRLFVPDLFKEEQSRRRSAVFRDWEVSGNKVIGLGSGGICLCTRATGKFPESTQGVQARRKSRQSAVIPRDVSKTLFPLKSCFELNLPNHTKFWQPLSRILWKNTESCEWTETTRKVMELYITQHYCALRANQGHNTQPSVYGTHNFYLAVSWFCCTVHTGIMQVPVSCCSERGFGTCKGFFRGWDTKGFVQAQKAWREAKDSGDVSVQRKTTCSRWCKQLPFALCGIKKNVPMRFLHRRI